MGLNTRFIYTGLPWVSACFVLIASGSTGQRIFFPGETRYEVVGSLCNYGSSFDGSCRTFNVCAQAYVDMNWAVQLNMVVICNTEPSREDLICCPHPDDPVLVTERTVTSPTTTSEKGVSVGEVKGEVTKSPDSRVGGVDENSNLQLDPIVSAPDIEFDFFCGSPSFTYYYGHIETDEHFQSYNIYHLNATADRLRSEGYAITINDMVKDAIDDMATDAIANFTYTLGSVTGTLAFDEVFTAAPAVGGKPAPEEFAYFTVLVGEKRDDVTHWMCDGALINRHWVVSAAHCFGSIRYSPNTLRIGDYDWSSDDEFGGEFPPHDVPIGEVVFYPDFNPNNRYHDIVLIKFEKSYPQLSTNINPVCLPWDAEGLKDLVGENVTFTGWGATEYRPGKTEKTPILQAVDLVVFNVSVCDDSYSDLLDYKFKWPQGMSKDTVVCAGWEEGGRDACQGDSGGPLTYPVILGEDDFLSPHIYHLAGIVSTGYGCGLKDFPGIYIPLNNAKYLSWIKAVAFKGYNDTATGSLIV